MHVNKWHNTNCSFQLDWLSAGIQFSNTEDTCSRFTSTGTFCRPMNTVIMHINTTLWDKKTALFYVCNNFLKPSSCILIIFGKHIPMEADVYIRCYALLVVHTRKEEKESYLLCVTDILLLPILNILIFQHVVSYLHWHTSLVTLLDFLNSLRQMLLIRIPIWVGIFQVRSHQSFMQ